MEEERIHELTVAELLGVIDHKVRGIQQLIIALRELAPDGSFSSSLSKIMIGTKELQEIYKGFLKMRRLEEETVKIDEFLRDTFNASSNCKGSVQLDRKKLEFICYTILGFGGKECEITSQSSEKGCLIRFSSPIFRELSVDELKSVSESISHLSLFAAEKITEKMNGTFDIGGGEIILEFPYFTPDY